MCVRTAVALLCILTGTAAFAQAGAAAMENEELNAQNYQMILEEVASHFRWTGTPEALETAEMISERLTAYGYAVEQQSFVFAQEIEGKQTSNEAVNVIAVKPANLEPTGDILIVSAHYDSKESTVGANDDASGEALLLELARVMQNVDTDTELRFISFSGEEQGLRGSAAYVESLTGDEKARIIGDIQIDMIGHVRSQATHVATAYGNAEWIAQAIMDASQELTGEAWTLTREAASDHASFSFTGVPAVLVTQDLCGSAENHRYIDNVSIIDAEKAVETGRVIEKVLRDVASDDTPSFREAAQSMRSANEAVPISEDTPILFGARREDVAVKLGAAGTFERDELGDWGYEQSHYIINAQWFDWESLETDFVYRKDTLTLDRVLIRTAPLGLSDEALGEKLTRALGEPEIFEDGTAQWGSSSMAENPSLRQYLIAEDGGEQVIEVVSFMHFNVGEDIACYDMDASAEDAAGDAAGDAADIALLQAVQKVIRQEDPYVKRIVSWTDGYSYVLGSCGADDISQSDCFTIRMDKNDFFNADGSMKDESKFLATAVHEYGHALTLNESQMNVSLLSDTINYNEIDLYRENSYMRAFYDRFYADDRQRSFYDFPEDYVNEYAGTAGMFEDIAESFMQFVIGERQQADTLAAQKINFFYDYPEMTQVRDHIRQNFGYSIEVNEE